MSDSHIPAGAAVSANGLLGLSPRAETAIVLVADPDDPRTALFQATLRRRGQSPARVLTWQTLAEQPVAAWAADLPDSGILRLDSPGRRFSTYCALLRRGAEDAAAALLPHLARQQIAVLPERKGQILYPDQWYLGLGAVLDDLTAFQRQRLGWRLPAPPADVRLLFCKAGTHRRLQAAGVPVPRAVGPVSSFDELEAQLRAANLAQVFIKLRYSSAAAGIIAYRRGPGGREVAYTTVDMENDTLFNTRRVRRLEEGRGIRTLIDALCRHRVHVEAWIPKAAVHGRACDLRALVVAGEPTHWVLRTSATPMTNLHLSRGLGRAPVELLRQRLTEEAWSQLVATCRTVGRLFPGSLQLAPDIAVAASLRRHYVLEVNAFGDYLNGVTATDGRSPYDVELDAVNGWNPNPP